MSNYHLCVCISCLAQQPMLRLKLGWGLFILLVLKWQKNGIYQFPSVFVMGNMSTPKYPQTVLMKQQSQEPKSTTIMHLRGFFTLFHSFTKLHRRSNNLR